jgi:hypothetical protein
MAKSLLETFEKLDAATKHALADITSPRLLAFSALEIAETQCGVERLTSEHIVACLESAGVAVKKLSVNRALAAATGYISSKKEGNETSYKLMTKGKREIEQTLGGEKMSVVRIEKNQPRTARLELADILKKLTGIVRVCDPYYGVRTLDLLDNFPVKTKVRFLTSKTNETGRKLQGAMKDFKKERPNVDFRLASAHAGLHDRFVITKDLILILGHGLKDIGGKESFIIRLDKDLVPDLIKSTIKAFDAKWGGGTAI